jgi:hypothetical protein
MATGLLPAAAAGSPAQRRHVIVSSVWDIVLWSVIPIVVLLPAFTVGTYWFFRHFNNRGRPAELPVERAYREATARHLVGR